LKTFYFGKPYYAVLLILLK